jgi:hypothetical protein
MDLIQLRDGGRCLAHRIPEQPRRSQCGTPMDGEIRFSGTEILEALRRLVEAAQRFWQVTEPEGDQTPIHGGFACLQLLAARVEEDLGSPEIGNSAARKTGYEGTDRAFLQCPGFPALIASRSHGCDGDVQVLKCLAILADDQQSRTTAEKHPVPQMPR